MKYYKRIINGLLKKELDVSPAVLLVGPMWCGKTFSAKKIAKSSLFLTPEDPYSNENVIADETPELAL